MDAADSGARRLRSVPHVTIPPAQFVWTATTRAARRVATGTARPAVQGALAFVSYLIAFVTAAGGVDPPACGEVLSRKFETDPAVCARDEYGWHENLACIK